MGVRLREEDCNVPLCLHLHLHSHWADHFTLDLRSTVLYALLLFLSDLAPDDPAAGNLFRTPFLDLTFVPFSHLTGSLSRPPASGPHMSHITRHLLYRTTSYKTRPRPESRPYP